MKIFKQVPCTTYLADWTGEDQGCHGSCFLVIAVLLLLSLLLEILLLGLDLLLTASHGAPAKRGGDKPIRQFGNKTLHSKETARNQ